MSAQERVRHGLCDPVRLFVKNEPHKLNKIQTGRVRLICSVSIVDFCVEKWLSKSQNNAEISRWFNLPSMSGMGLHDEGIRIIYHRVASQLQSLELETSDIIGFDQSVQAEELRHEAECRIALRTGTWDSKFGDPSVASWANAVRARAEVSMRAVRVTSDGYFWEALDDGIMLSGCPNTASSNSRIRWSISQLGRETPAFGICMGDDAVTASTRNPVEFYASLGHPIKEVRILQPTPYELAQFEFCSHLFRMSEGHPIAEPLNWEKSLYRLLCHSFSDELLGQFKYTMRHSPRLEHCLSVCSSVGWAAEKIFVTENAKNKEVECDTKQGGDDCASHGWQAEAKHQPEGAGRRWEVFHRPARGGRDAEERGRVHQQHL